MSMCLRCIYKEKFTSVLGKTFEYRDELRLETVRDPDSWILLCWNNDGSKPWKELFGYEKTNQEIYDHYLAYIKQAFSEKYNKVFKRYSHEDNIRIIQGVDQETLVPVKVETWFDIHKSVCDEFFEKYGINNVSWEAV